MNWRENFLLDFNLFLVTTILFCNKQKQIIVHNTGNRLAKSTRSVSLRCVFNAS